MQALIGAELFKDSAAIGRESLCTLAQRAYNCHTGYDLQCSLDAESDRNGFDTDGQNPGNLGGTINADGSPTAAAHLESNCPEMRQQNYCTLEHAHARSSWHAHAHAPLCRGSTGEAGTLRTWGTGRDGSTSVFSA